MRYARKKKWMEFFIDVICKLRVDGEVTFCATGNTDQQVSWLLLIKLNLETWKIPDCVKNESAFSQEFILLS